jgi:N6-L-threonylcarbamoyladenine synthase
VGPTIQKALAGAAVRIEHIDVIAVSQAPGLGFCLRVGMIAARSLALRYDKPLVGVNHCVAHLEIGHLINEACTDPVLLYCSGANTQVIAYEGGRYRVFGETLDMGIGNFLDSVGRLMGLGFPAGPAIERMAREGKTYIELPYVVKGMDVSVSGLYTHLRRHVKASVESGSPSKEDLCFSLQETVFAALMEVAERAMAHTRKTQLLLGGGVACNGRLQEMARLMCADRRGQAFFVPNQYNVDNAAMIAWLGSLMFKAGVRLPIEKSYILPYERTDDVDVVWR